MKRTLFVLSMLAACWPTFNAVAQLQYSAQSQTTSVDLWKSGFPEFTNSFPGINRYYRVADHTEKWVGRRTLIPEYTDGPFIQPTYDLTNHSTLLLSSDQTLYLINFSGQESACSRWSDTSDTKYSDAHTTGLDTSGQAGFLETFSPKLEVRSIYWPYPILDPENPDDSWDFGGVWMPKCHNLISTASEPWNVALWTNHVTDVSAYNTTTSDSADLLIPIGWTMYSYYHSIFEDFTHVNATITRDDGVTCTVYTNSVSPTCEHDYHWISVLSTPDWDPNGYYCATGSCFTATTLSNEFKTADLLPPFSCQDTSWNPLVAGSSVTMGTAQEEAQITGSRVRFSLRSPIGDFALPYRLRVHFDANSGSGIALPALDLDFTNSVLCQGDGQTGCYPVGKSFGCTAQIVGEF